jgi:hypothetical protein
LRLPLPELWDVLAAFPLTYVRDTANALMIEADTLPHRIYNLSSGYPTKGCVLVADYRRGEAVLGVIKMSV